MTALQAPNAAMPSSLKSIDVLQIDSIDSFAGMTYSYDVVHEVYWFPIRKNAIECMQS